MRIVNAFLIFIFTTLIANFTFAGTIVYDVFEPNGNRHIWAINEDGTNKTQLTFGNVKDCGPAVSPNGKLIAFASDREGLGIYLYDVEEKTVQKIYDHTAPYGPLGAGGLFFSSDSNNVYFYYGYQSGKGEYYYVTVDGSDVGQLTDFNLNTRAVDISPDGTKLVYSQQSGSNAGAQEIYTSNLDGTSVARLTSNSKNDSGPKWSNDGTQILWHQRASVGGRPLNLYIMNADGSDQQALTSYPNSLVTGFNFSPDGTQVAYTVDINGVRDIFIVNLDGSNAANITNDESYNSALDWTPHSLLNQAPVAYYPFNGNANDESDNGNDGVVNGATLTIDRCGNPNSAYYFDGTDDYIEVPFAEILDLEEFTLAAWIKADSLETHNFILARVEDENIDKTNYYLRIRDNQFNVGFEDVGTGPDNQNLFSDTLAVLDEWYFVVGTRSLLNDGTDKSILKLYINGIFDNSYVSRDQKMSHTIAPLFIGALYEPDVNNILYHFSGIIDEVRIYNRSLSETEIQELFIQCPDTDEDGLLNDEDNCPFDYNPIQEDNDSDGIGDVCDNDDDNDGVLDTSDNCQYDSNSDQANNDPDEFGDICDDDDDNDTILDGDDNCPFGANTDQADIDLDGQGDVCDGDLDGDNVINDVDNCPYAPNPSQEDNDIDGEGDACDNDDDDDGVLDVDDNCPDIVNPDQDDLDSDNIGDTCDSDIDGDGVDNPEDNCELTPNINQEDNDLDDVGDACDPDDDNDTVLDVDDNCPFLANPAQTNTDGDNLGDACDPDIDNDNVANEEDNCEAIYNPDQEDNDWDSEGDACDADDDDDGVLDENDNCQYIPNSYQADLDGDGQGDPCDGDLDGDGVANDVDNCPDTANSSQFDNDIDGLGDTCDSDDDNDGVSDDQDNCIFIVNVDQSDNDADGFGDVCDDDDDNDNVTDDLDNCQFVANTSQANWDGDEYGDACDDDIDDDGVDNNSEICEFTPIDEIVDPNTGCSLDQLCPCEGPRGTTLPWKNHGKYVSCMAHATNSFVDMGLISHEEKGDIMSESGSSDCGQKKNNNQ